MKYFTFIFLFLLFSCGEKQSVQLPKSNITIVDKVDDLTPVYIFFKVKDNDTIADVNRSNTIISTNWVFNIDKRLPLKLVIPQVMKLQEKKRKDSDYKNELAQNYYTYMDSVKKNLAFLPFTEVYYKLEKPIGTAIYFNKKNEILIENSIVKKEQLTELINESLPENISKNFIFLFNKDLDFGSYIEDKIFIESLNVKMNRKEEFIY